MTEPDGRRPRGGRGSGQLPPQTQPPPPGALRSLNSREVAFHLLNAMQLEDEEVSGTAAAGLPSDSLAAARGAAAGLDAASAAQRASIRAFPIELNELGSAAFNSGYHPQLERLDEGPPSAPLDDVRDQGLALDGMMSPFSAPGVLGPTFDSSDGNISPFGAPGAADAVGGSFSGPGAAAADTIMSPFGAPDAAPVGLRQSSDDFPLLPPTTAGPAAAAGAGGGRPRTAASTKLPAAEATPAAPRPSLKPTPTQKQQQQSKGPHGPSPPTSARCRGRRLIPLRRVMRDAYEYHGLNELGLFFLFAMLTNVVLYFHWTDTTANFKNTMQYAFKSYGNPDWQGQSFAGATTMNDGVEYLSGWLQFWIQRAQDVDWPPSPFGFPGQTVRVGEYAEIVYARLMVNLDNNCGRGSLSCWRDDSEVNRTLLAYGWRDVGEMDHQMATQASSLKARITGKGRSNWLVFPIIAPLIDGAAATREEYLQRLYAGVTPATSINHDDDLAREALASVCPNGTGLSVFPATSEVTCEAQKKLPPGAILAAATPETLNGLKPIIARYAYALTLEVLAIDVMSRPHAPDMALFSMQVQRSDVPSDWPHGVLWHITTTLPVRFSFYSLMPWDAIRAATEGALLVAVAIVAYSQLWQQRVVKWQHGDTRSFWKQFWNVFEFISTGVLCLWVLFYIALATVLLNISPRWRPKLWDAVGPPAPAPDPAAIQLREVGRFAYFYSLWLFGGILVDSLVCLRILRYMRIHPGLKAFYTVFIIAAREFLDFAVFLLYIMLLLGSAIFAFFQLTGGNDQFVRFSDGLSVMTRLTFGFLSYEDFQNQALGLGSAVSAVTLFFWCGVLLLVVFSQNIILAIVAEAYEQAKFDLGRADTSFVVLIFLRFAFLLVLLSSRVRMVVHTLRKAVAACCWGGGNGPPSSMTTSCTTPGAASPAGNCGGGDSNSHSGADVGAGGKDTSSGARDVGASDVEAPSSPKGRMGSQKGLQRAITHLKSMRLDKHDERVYREMMAISEHSLRSRWGSWARRYWAPWAVARTPGVRSLMALYQDFASYKIKTQPAWIGAQEAARATLTRTPSEVAMLPTPSPDNEGSSGEDALQSAADVALPDLSQGEGVVTEEELTRLLLVSMEMGRHPPVWPSPFAGVRRGSIDALVHAIASVYGFDAEEPPTDSICLTSAPSVAPTGGGGGGGAPSPLKASHDLRLGSMGEGRGGGGGGGFFSRLAGIRRGGPDGTNTGLVPEGTLAGVPGGRGAPPPQAMRALMREQRRLEEQIARANRSTEQLMEMMARQLANQRRTLSDQGRQLSTVAASVDRIAGAFTVGGGGGSGGGAPNASGPAAPGPTGSGGGSSLFGQRVGGWKRPSFAARAFSNTISQDGRSSLEATAGPATAAAAAVAAAATVAAAASADAGTAPSSAALPTEAPSTGGPLTPVGSGISAGASSGGGGDGSSDSVAALQQRMEEQQKTLDVILGLLQETKSRGSVGA